MFVHNKTLTWLHGKTDQEKHVLLSNARKDVKAARLKFAERMKEIERCRRANLEEKMRKAEKARVKQLEDYTSGIITWGLWQSEAQIDFHVQTVLKTKSEKIEALKSQLNFRKHVLLQKPKGDEYKNVYNVTKMIGKRRVSLDVELISNVKKVVEHAFTATPNKDNEEDDDIAILVGKNIKMYFEGDDGSVKTSWDGHVISTVKFIK